MGNVVGEPSMEMEKCVVEDGVVEKETLGKVKHTNLRLLVRTVPPEGLR